MLVLRFACELALYLYKNRKAMFPPAAMPIPNPPDVKIIHRFNSIRHIILTEDFRYFEASAWLRKTEDVQAGLLLRCRVPDNTDLSMSKRAWERTVQHWRKSLKEIRAREQ